MRTESEILEQLKLARKYQEVLLDDNSDTALSCIFQEGRITEFVLEWVLGLHDAEPFNPTMCIDKWDKLLKKK